MVRQCPKARQYAYPATGIGVLVRNHNPPALNGAAPDDLTRLLESEGLLAVKLERAHAEAEGIVRAANEEAANVDAAASATIAGRLAEVTERHEQELTAELQRMRDASSRAIARFDGVTDAELRALAAHVLARVLSVEQP